MRHRARGGWFVRYLRGRLHRRIFLSFGATIAVFGVAMFVLFSWNWRNDAWSNELERIQTFTAGRFAEVWSEPDARTRLADAIARDLLVQVTLRDAEGAFLSEHGGTCASKSFPLRIERGAAPLGTAELCLMKRASRRAPHWPAILIAGATLWFASGRLARRLTRPLAELARVAEALGQGKLDTRVQFRERYGEFYVLGQVLNEMAGRIERQIADQRELLAAVSHELRTPLARLRILAELLRSEGGKSSLLEELDREVEEIDELVGGLLAQSKLDFSSIDRRSLDARELAQRALQRAEVSLHRLRIEGDDFVLEADPTLMARALANLLQNAKQHGAGAESLNLRATPDHIVFAVEDRGPGFTQEQLPRLFRAFAAGKDSTGLGMGLSLVQRIAEAHGGRAFAENRSNAGARVGLEIPKTQAG